MRVFVLLLVVAAFLASAVAAPAKASRTIVLKERFHVVGDAFALTNGEYTLINGGTTGADEFANERTGKHFVVPPPPACQFSIGQDFVGGPWLLRTCSTSAVDLYALPNGPWRAVPIAQSCQGWNAAPGESTCLPIGVGRFWIQFNETCYHCTNTPLFQNVQTGATTGAPPVKQSIIDLNAPSLLTRLCRPLTPPPPSGGLTLASPFAITYRPSGVFLERCSARLHVRLGRMPLQWWRPAGWSCGSRPTIVCVACFSPAGSPL